MTCQVGVMLSLQHFTHFTAIVNKNILIHQIEKVITNNFILQVDNNETWKK